MKVALVLGFTYHMQIAPSNEELITWGNNSSYMIEANVQKLVFQSVGWILFYIYTVNMNAHHFVYMYCNSESDKNDKTEYKIYRI